MQQLLIWLKIFNKKFILLSLLFISKMKSEDHCGWAISYRVPQHTKKLDCPAEITMREVVMFLSFKVGRCRKEVSYLSSSLKKSAFGERRFCIQSSDITDHRGHAVGKVQGLNYFKIPLKHD